MSPTQTWFFHVDRIVGSSGNYRNPGGNAITSIITSKGEGKGNRMPEQREADGYCVFYLCAGQ